MATASVNGIHVGYDDEGGGAPLVLVHGHPFDRSMWAPQISNFTGSGWRTIAPDLRGYGESGLAFGAVTWETYAHDIAALIDHLEADDIVLGGLSMGGQIVMEFYRLFPDRVRALVLADTFCQAETENGRKARHDQADRLIREGMRGYAWEVLAKMLAPYNVTALPAVADHVLDMMLRTSPEGCCNRITVPCRTPRLHGPACPDVGAGSGCGRPGRRVHPGRRRGALGAAHSPGNVGRH